MCRRIYVERIQEKLVTAVAFMEGTLSEGDSIKDLTLNSLIF